MHRALVMCAALACAAGSATAARTAAQDTPRISLESIDGAIERGARWLQARQAESGAFEPASASGACPVALTGLAAWSLSEIDPRFRDPEGAPRAARFLLERRQGDGGIYDPARGLAVYSSGVAARALRAVGPREGWPELAAALAGAELYAYRSAGPESIVDAVRPGEVSVARTADAARDMLARSTASDGGRRRALEFLSRTKRDAAVLPSRLRTPNPRGPDHDVGPFTYDDLLPLIYVDLAPEHQVAMRVHAALHAHYVPERNPDLTQRYGPAGFTPGTQGLFYYYFVVAKTQTTFRERLLVTADGARHDWAGELGALLVRMQRDDGSWANVDPTWWESEPVLATSLALLTLVRCREALTWTQ